VAALASASNTQRPQPIAAEPGVRERRPGAPSAQQPTLPAAPASARPLPAALPNVPSVVRAAPPGTLPSAPSVVRPSPRAPVQPAPAPAQAQTPVANYEPRPNHSAAALRDRLEALRKREP
jgi:hypothetical protein